MQAQIQIKIKIFTKKSISPIFRPESLAKDKTPMQRVVNHAVEFYKKKNYFPYAVAILQPTSPFRKISTINEACKIFLKIILILLYQLNP